MMVKLVRNDLLTYINFFLQEQGYSNSDKYIDMPEESILNTSLEVDMNAKEFYNVNNLKLNVGQQDLFNRVVDLIDKDKGGLLNFNAPGESGKNN